MCSTFSVMHQSYTVGTGNVGFNVPKDTSGLGNGGDRVQIAELMVSGKPALPPEPQPAETNQYYTNFYLPKRISTDCNITQW